MSTRRDESHEGQKGHDRHVLQEQDRNDPLALRRRELALLVEDLEDDCGRGQHETDPEDEGDGRRVTKKNADARKESTADRDLKRAKAKYLPAQAP
jgi:hypothetical protein